MPEQGNEALVQDNGLMLSAVFLLVMLDAPLFARFDDAFAVDVTDLILLAVLVSLREYEWNPSVSLGTRGKVGR